jgi:hypothetical protein
MVAAQKVRMSFPTTISCNFSITAGKDIGRDWQQGKNVV